MYLVLPHAEWSAFKAAGELCPVEPDERDRAATAWLNRQIAARTGIAEDGGCLREPTYAFLSKPPPMWFRHKRAVLKVRVPEERAVLFDDHGYVEVVNALGNGLEHFDGAEGAEALATDEEKLRSLERMFDVVGPGTGPDDPFVELRAFVTGAVTRHMVRKVWVYCGDERLRRRR
jgi:hypothetical protein